jgi:hypothetical protein
MLECKEPEEDHLSDVFARRGNSDNSAFFMQAICEHAVEIVF